MTTHRLVLLSLSVLLAACGEKDGTTDTTSATTTAPETSGAQTTTAETTEGSGTTADAPTTGGSTTAATTEEPGTTTGDSTGCAGECGVIVEMGSSMCDEQNPDMVPASLAAEPNGAGAIKVTEMGFETSCCLELDPQVAVDGMTLNVTYTEVGDPCDCICYYTIDFVVSGQASGMWTVNSGPQSVDVVVP